MALTVAVQEGQHFTLRRRSAQKPGSHQALPLVGADQTHLRQAGQLIGQALLQVLWGGKPEKQGHPPTTQAMPFQGPAIPKKKTEQFRQKPPLPCTWDALSSPRTKAGRTARPGEAERERGRRIPELPQCSPSAPRTLSYGLEMGACGMWMCLSKVVTPSRTHHTLTCEHLKIKNRKTAQPHFFRKTGSI